jgi:hypothetical protein
LGYPVPGRNKYWNLSLLVGGVSKLETINYAHESHEKGCAVDARQKLKSTDSTSHQRGRPTSTKPKLPKEKNQKEWEKWSGVPGGCLIPRWTGRQTVGRNITLTLALFIVRITRNTQIQIKLPCYK